MTPLGAAIAALAALLAWPAPGWTREAEPAPERTPERVLWQIGVPDGSSGEFRYDFAEYTDPDAAPVLHVGTDAAATSWRSFHPGPASGTAGGREHPYTILFELPSPPAEAGGVYRLRVSILHLTPRLSHLRVELNGHRGTFYFDSRLDYRAGDQLGLTVPYASSATKVIELPAEFFLEGRNRLVLTALDDPPDVEKVWAWAPGHAGFFYDAIELTHDPGGSSTAESLEARLVPTIFYRAGGQPISQILRAELQFGRMPSEWTLRLQIGTTRRELRIATDDEFGEHRLDLDVPAWSGLAAASLEVAAGGTSRKFAFELLPGKKWTLLVVPHTHIDMGFTASPATVEELQSDVVDGVVELIAQHPNFRYLLDSFWAAERYLAGRSAPRREAFLSAVRDGKIGLPPEYSNQHTGAVSLEGLIRSLYDGHLFARRFSLPLDPPHIVDVPSYTGSYASVLRAAGFGHFLAAANSWRSPILLQGRWHERSPFYWEGPDGGRVLMWYAWGYMQVRQLFGMPYTLSAGRSSLPVFLQAYERPDYAPSSVILFGSQAENTRFDPAQADLAHAWSKLYAWPKLEYATFGEAITRIESEGEGRFEVVKGDFGPYWEDGLGSDARHTALHGANQHRIANAEIMSTLASVFDPARAPDRQRLEFAWKNLLLSDEHTWTSMIATAEPDHAQTLKQMSLKSARVQEAARAIDETIHRSWAQLAATIGSPRQVLAVFNSRSFERSGWVETDVFPDREPFDLSRNRPVRHELLALRESALRSLGVGHARIRFRAEDVPPLGYKLYSLRPVGPKGRKAPVVPLDIADRVFESPHYRVELDPEAGGMTSILDKELGVELIEPASPYRLGALLYVTGGDDYPRNSLYRYSKVLPPPRLSVHPAVSGRLVSARKLPFGTVLELESSAPNFPVIRTRILLHDEEKKIELTYELEKKAVRSREAVYFAFPFAGAVEADRPGPAPRFAYGSQNGWVDPARDIVAGGSREWFSVTHWAAARRPQFTAAVIPVDAPLVAFGDIARGHWPERFEPATGAVYSWVMNNYWPMNFPAEQGGSFRFRYVLRSYREFDPATLTRDAAAELNPLEASLLAAGPATESPLPAATSLFDLGSPNLAMVTWKQAEDGRGSILRLLEISGVPGQTTLSSPLLRFDEAWKTSALEEDLLPLKVTSRGVELSFAGFEIVTLRLLDPQRREDDRHARSHLSPARHYDDRRATRTESGTRLW